MKPAGQVLQAFDRIRRAQTGAGYAPHKPMLILLVLARVQHGQSRLVHFSDIDAKLKEVLTEFSPGSAAKTRHYPFWHLRNDKQGAVWEFNDPLQLIKCAPGGAPSLSELRDPQVSAGFPADIDQALRATPGLLEAVAARVLDAYFPATLHGDIAAALGLSLQPPAVLIAAEPDPPAYGAVTRRRRDPAFRERVLRAYEYRCCVCGFDLRIGSVSAGLEAAHIQWHTHEGLDVEPNGLSLCALRLAPQAVRPGRVHRRAGCAPHRLQPARHRRQPGTARRVAAPRPCLAVAAAHRYAARASVPGLEHEKCVQEAGQGSACKKYLNRST
ncbi:MAG: hypothetical protein EXR37_06485 [Limnohabitans sp.]|nr:hypothetical protein [Limnohabitans sp.]